ncbi:MAG: YCF48-related protein [Actinobacteria bacterium]|nr:YCF48-related protein [Actinomycetota bacterium]
MGRKRDTVGARRAIAFGLAGLMVLLVAAGVAAAAGGRSRPATSLVAARGVPSSVLTDVCFTDAAHGWIAGQAGYVLSTSDGGATWTKSRVLPSVNGEMDHVVAIDPDTACAVGASSQVQHPSVVMRTSDGGSSWQTQRKQAGSKAIELDGVDFVDAEHGWACGLGAQSGKGVVLATSDGGATWGRQTTPQSAWLTQICFVDLEHGWASADHSVVRTTDGGATWTKVTVIRGPDKDIEDVYFVDATHGWAVGNSGTISATTDGGATWAAQKSGVKTGLLAVCFTSAQQGWTVGEDSVVLKTADGGATWVNGR